MIRQVCIDDIPTILDMLRFFRLECPSYAFTDEDADYVGHNLQTLLSADVMFGTIDEDARGCMLGVVSDTWYSKRREAHEQVLWVYPPYRGSMLAARLIKAFEQQCSLRDIEYVGVGVSSGLNEENTVRLYEKLGYRRSSYGLQKRLDDV